MIETEKARELFKSGLGATTIDECHRQFVNGLLKPEIRFDVDYFAILRYVEVIFEHKYGRELRIISDPNTDALIDTLASGFEGTLLNRMRQLRESERYPPEQVKVISINGKSDALEKFKEKYEPVLKVAYASTVRSGDSLSEIISDNCFISIDHSLKGNIDFRKYVPESRKKLFEHIWLKITDPAEYQRRQEKPANRLLRFLFHD